MLNDFSAGPKTHLDSSCLKVYATQFEVGGVPSKDLSRDRQLKLKRQKDMQIDKQTERQADCYKAVGDKNTEAEVIEFALRKSSTSNCQSSAFNAKCPSTYRNTSLMKRD